MILNLFKPYESPGSLTHSEIVSCPKCGVQQSVAHRSIGDLLHCPACRYIGSGREWMLWEMSGIPFAEKLPEKTAIIRTATEDSATWSLPSYGKSDGGLLMGGLLVGFLVPFSGWMIPSLETSSVASSLLGVLALMGFWGLALWFLYFGSRLKWTKVDLIAEGGELAVVRHWLERSKSSRYRVEEILWIEQMVEKAERSAPITEIEIASPSRTIRIGKGLTPAEASALVADLKLRLEPEMGQKNTRKNKQTSPFQVVGVDLFRGERKAILSDAVTIAASIGFVLWEVYRLSQSPGGSGRSLELHQVSSSPCL
jgi:hypothetical protein